MGPKNSLLRGVTILIIAGLVAEVGYAAQLGFTSATVEVASVALMLAGACLLGGGLLGFLFGLPRTVQDVGQRNSTTSGLPSEPQNVSYHANTNLEQISDWLTKILVGVGLTQIGQL